MEKIGVLFVCTGNICRSPTAHAVFEQMVDKAGLGNAFIVQSAGTHGYHVGQPPDDRAIKTAKSHGVDMNHLRARRVEQVDFQTFDYIYAMDAGHYNLLKEWDNRNNKARLLMFGIDDVADPYYGTMDDFGAVFCVIERGCARLISQILQDKLPEN